MHVYLMSIEYVKTQLRTRACKHLMNKKKIVGEVDKYNNERWDHHKQYNNP